MIVVFNNVASLLLFSLLFVGESASDIFPLEWKLLKQTFFLQDGGGGGMVPFRAGNLKGLASFCVTPVLITKFGRSFVLVMRVFSYTEEKMKTVTGLV